MRDKLIELLKHSMCSNGECFTCEGFNDTKLCDEIYYGKRADYLLANGVVVPPCPVGTPVYVVGQFMCDLDGYGMSFYKDWDIRTRAFTLDMIDNIGTYVFLDRKEAEVELRRKRYEGER